jgi:transposase
VPARCLLDARLPGDIEVVEGGGVAERVQVRDITNEEGNRLLRIVRRSSGSVVTWRRAQMVLLSAQGMDVAAIAKVTFTSHDRVRDVLHNFNLDGFDALYPRYAGGRPPTFTLAQRRQIKQVALSRPQDHDLPFSTWSLAKLAEFLVAEGVVDDISHEGLRLLLREEGVSFQVIKTWKQSSDPDFEAKKNRILHLYGLMDGIDDVGDGDPTQLGVAGDGQPGPAVGGLGGAELRAGPAEGLLEQPEGVLKIEPTEKRLPPTVDVGGGGAGARRPQPPGLGVTVAGRVVDLQADQRALDDGQLVVVVQPVGPVGEPVMQPVPTAGHRGAAAAHLRPAAAAVLPAARRLLSALAKRQCNLPGPAGRAVCASAATLDTRPKVTTVAPGAKTR